MNQVRPVVDSINTTGRFHFVPGDSSEKRSLVIMVNNSPLFEVERQEDIVILTPLRNLGEFVMMDLQGETEAILASFEQNQAPHLLIDFCKTDYLESTALGFLATLHKQVTERQGKVICCNPSQHERQLLGITKLNQLLPIFDSREDALEALKKQK